MMTYPKMKETSIPWLGKIPEHWETKRLKYCAPLTTEKCAESKDDVIALENIESWTGRLIYTESTFESDGISYRKGDVIFGKLRPYLAKVFLADNEGEAVGDVFVLRPNANTNPAYVAHSLRTTNFIDTINASTYGSKMPRVSWDYMGNLVFPLPPLPEQHAIAAFLDKATAKIDALIAEQEKLCTLLAEKRKALISHVVTKGLDPKAKLKPSGISWLGDIPEHWGVKKLKYLGDAIIGLTYSPENVVDDKGTLVLRSSNVQNGRITYDDNVFVNSDIPNYLRTCEGDILICSRNGSRDLIGKNAIIKKSDANHSFGAFMTVYRSSYWRYIFYIFNSTLFSFLSGSFFTSTVNQLTTGNLNNMVIPFPTRTEQQAIAAYLDKATAKLDALAAKAEEGIALLKERRAALISEVVTGKVRVA